jgi:hypothetical protein
MALAFPTNPAVNQTHTDGVRSWKWTGARWQSVQASPLAHASSHAIGGSDALTPLSIGAATTAQGAKADSALQSGAAISTISGLQTALDGKQASGSYAPASNISPSAITGTAVVTSDQRLSNSRTPTSHKSSHAIGGSDPLTAADIGAAALQDADPDSSAPVLFNGNILILYGNSNGKNYYHGRDAQDATIRYDLTWNGSAWQVVTAFDDGTGGPVPSGTNYATGNTTYPWLATWSGITVTRKAVNYTQSLSVNSSAGVSTTASRSDHVHALPSLAQIGAEPAFSTLPIAKGGTGATTAAQARTNLGVAGASADIQIFASTGTWTKPSGAKFVDIQCVGGGGGGGCGAKVGAATAVYGGLGGSSGGYSRITVDAAQLNDASYTITIGAGGTGAVFGGAAAAPTSTTVVGATDGRIAGVNVGGVAPNGGTSPPANTFAGVPQGNLSNPATIDKASGNSGISNLAPQSGAAGGGCSTSAAWAGGASTNPLTGASAAGGANTGTNGTAVTVKTQTALIFNGSGGSGGGGSITSNGGNGANATGYGCGGGGGGSCSNASGTMVGGNGGNGKSGVVIITTFF